jgi:cobalt/nickel transport system permease protein
MEAKAAARTKIIMASVIGCIVTLQTGAFSVVVETSLSGITELPFGAFCALMQPIHLAIGLVEGLITTAILIFVFEARPELLQEVNAKTGGDKGKLTLKKTLVALAVLVVMVGGALSLFASSNPDGLEWALFGNTEAGYNENMALDEEDYGIESGLSEKAASVQEKTAFLPDYSFADSESAAGTAVSGIVGSAIVAVAAAGISVLGRFFRKKKQA